MNLRFEELNSWKLILEYEDERTKEWTPYDWKASPIANQELDYVWDKMTYVYLERSTPHFKFIYCYEVISILEKYPDHDNPMFKRYCRYVLKTLWEQHDREIKRLKELERISNQTRRFIYTK